MLIPFKASFALEFVVIEISVNFYFIDDGSPMICFFHLKSIVQTIWPLCLPDVKSANLHVVSSICFFPSEIFLALKMVTLLGKKN